MSRSKKSANSEPLCISPEDADFDETTIHLTPARVIFLAVLESLEDEEQAEDLAEHIMDRLFQYAEDNLGTEGEPCIVLADRNGFGTFSDMIPGDVADAALDFLEDQDD